MPGPNYVAAIDQGTTGTRFMIFDHAGKDVASHYEEHHQIYPQPGWVEHDAGEIGDRTHTTIGGGMAKGQVRANDLAAIGITNQRVRVRAIDGKGRVQGPQPTSSFPDGATGQQVLTVTVT